jgi:hypothetical protein
MIPIKLKSLTPKSRKRVARIYLQYLGWLNQWIDDTYRNLSEEGNGWATQDELENLYADRRRLESAWD